MSEIITPEIHTEEFNHLLFEMRSLLFGVRQDDVVDHLTVTEHTDTRTVMRAGDPRESVVHFVIEETNQGILARCLRAHATPDGMDVRDRTILLSDPMTSRMFTEVRGTMSKTMSKPMHDVNSVLDKMNTKSKPLTQEVTEQWYSQVHELWQHMPEHKPETNRNFPPSVSPPFRRLFRRHVTRV